MHVPGRRCERAARALLLGALLLAAGAAHSAGSDHASVVHAAGILVTSFADTVAFDGQCTLREAITNANTNASTSLDCNPGAGDDIITFAASGTINLTGTLPAILSAGGGLVIDATSNPITISGQGQHRLLTAGGGAVVELKRLTLTQGVNPAGALDVHGGANVTLTNSTVSNNTGSGVLSIEGAVLVRGGGTLWVLGSTFSNNANSMINGRGGSITNDGSTQVFNSTFSGNQAGGGGALLNGPGAALVVRFSTITGNQAGSGGAIYNASGSATVSNTLISGNTASVGPACYGGIATGVQPSLVDNLANCSVSGSPPIVGTAILGPLAFNGGPTQTHALLAGSLGVNAGDAVACSLYPISSVDQRGSPRPQGPGCDLGAYEMEWTLGGKDLTISPDAETRLTWTPGTIQTLYNVLRLNLTDSTQTIFGPLPRTATMYADFTTVPGALYCYVVLPYEGTTLLGVSDIECVQTGIASGTLGLRPPTLALNQSNTATITWRRPEPGADFYLVMTIPLAGGEVGYLPVSPPNVQTTHDTGGAPYCYVVVAVLGSSVDISDLVCGIPGVASLAGDDHTAERRAPVEVPPDFAGAVEQARQGAASGNIR